MSVWNLYGSLLKEYEYSPVNPPLSLPGNRGIEKVSLYWNTLLMLSNYGEVWGKGSEEDHLIWCKGDVSRASLPVKIPQEIPLVDKYTRIIDVACSRFDIYAVDQYGYVLKRGRENNCRIVHLENRFKVQSLHCGEDFVVALDTNGGIWGSGSLWGYNNDFERINTNGRRVAKVSCGNTYFAYIDTAGRLWLPHSDPFTHSMGVRPLNKNLRVKDVSCSYIHMAVIDELNNLWMIGGNMNGRMGLPKSMKRSDKLIKVTPNIAEVKCGMDHTVMIDLLGNVWGTGSNEYGQLGPYAKQGSNYGIVQGFGRKAKEIECGRKSTVLH